MKSLFGIPVDTLLVVLVLMFLVGVAVMGVAALRNRVMFKVALRNIPRRRSQSVLIVVGLMLATLLFSASFATGDTLAHSIRVQTLETIGMVDEVVRSDLRDDTGRRAYFDAGVAAEIAEALAGAPVDGTMPAIVESVPAVVVGAGRSEPSLTVYGVDDRGLDAFDPPVDVDTGARLSVDNLGADELLVSSEAAADLGVSTGDEVALFFSFQPTRLRVAGVYEGGGNAADLVSAMAPLSNLQQIVGRPGEINRVFISNDGGLTSGAKHTDEVIEIVDNLLAERNFDVNDIKRFWLDLADEIGSQFLSIFLLFGTFSIVAGILLIFLIFIMLAAERKRELGIARAVGAQRDHIVRLFTFEGAAYALMAAAVGSALGVAVGFVMVRIIAGILGGFDIEIQFAFRWQSLVIAYTLGMAATFLVVLMAAGRVSSLNIVRAIRDIPEPPGTRSRLLPLLKRPFAEYKRSAVLLARLRVLNALRALALSSTWAWAVFIGASFMAGYAAIAVGLLLVLSGVNSEEAAPFLIGLSFLCTGVPLALRHRRVLGDRAAFSAAGVLLVALWIAPWDWELIGLPAFQAGFEMFILSGVVLVVGAVWVIVYNSDYLVGWISGILGRGRTLSPVMRTALAYPMASKFRTGMTLAMFSLVVFTLMVLAFISTAFAAATEDTRQFSGGFDVRARVNPANPMDDFNAALDGADGLASADFSAVGGQSGLPVKVRQGGYDDELEDSVLTGVDAGYTAAVTYGFSLKDERYADDAAVWRALTDEPGTAVVSALIVPGREDFGGGGGPSSFRLQGFFRDDETLPEIIIEAYDRAEQRTVSLRVIGVLEDAVFPDFTGIVLTGYDTLQELGAVPLLQYQIRLQDPDRAPEVVDLLEETFAANGLNAASLAKIVRDNFAVQLAFNRLIQGFMGLGLVVGVAALGVVAARSVVERRGLIGMLRAMGYQRSMVQASFLIESSFIALLGILTGTGLAFGLSVGIVNEIAQDFEAVRFGIPWVSTGVVFVVAYGASMLTTFLPARQASRIYPAEALRFAE